MKMNYRGGNKKKKAAKEPKNINKSDGEKTPKKSKTMTKSPSSSQRKKSEYIPRKGSGAYAVLITLYQESDKESYRGFLSKSQLQESAQPLANESLVTANNKTEHYTAWSSVNNLVKKELIRKWSNPAKYDL